MVRQLAERMVEIDLLGRAGDLLQGLVSNKLHGLEKGKVGTPAGHASGFRMPSPIRPSRRSISRSFRN